ncbi:hypothetical protein IT411_00860 [Candidatus Peregrinibacteria bacterium]|nr:hypothetical protein [Candidatus Peregrinibacteria bacterium]
MERPLFKYRVGIIAETPWGPILTQEIKDRARVEALQIIEDKRLAALKSHNKALANRYTAGKAIINGGRFSLPGGGPSPRDFEEIGETGLIDEIGIKIVKRQGEDDTLLFPDIDRLPQEIIMRIERIMRRTAVREIREEFNIEPEPDSLGGVSQIMGATRRHLIYIVALDGEIKITDPNISGIGFIDQKHVIPLSKFFFQGHVRTLYSHYICNPDRDGLAKAYASRFIVPFNLVEGWFHDEIAAYNYLSGKGRHRTHMPRILESRPAFRIRGKDGQLQELRSDSNSFTVSKEAKLIPRAMLKLHSGIDTPPLAKPRRSPSNPTMPKVGEKKPA